MSSNFMARYTFDREWGKIVTNISNYGGTVNLARGPVGEHNLSSLNYEDYEDVIRGILHPKMRGVWEEPWVLIWDK